jgi:hypothetical protein
VLLASWYQVEAIRHGRHVGYPEALRQVTLRPYRLWFDGIGGCVEAALVLLTIRCWWRYWRHGRTQEERFIYFVTRNAGAVIGACFATLIANFLGSLTTEPFTIGLLLVTLLIGVPVGFPLGLILSFMGGRRVARSLTFPK